MKCRDIVEYLKKADLEFDKLTVRFQDVKDLFTLEILSATCVVQDGKTFEELAEENKLIIDGIINQITEYKLNGIYDYLSQCSVIPDEADVDNFPKDIIDVKIEELKIVADEYELNTTALREYKEYINDIESKLKKVNDELDENSEKKKYLN